MQDPLVLGQCSARPHCLGLEGCWDLDRSHTWVKIPIEEMETTKHSHKRAEHKENRTGWDHTSEETCDEKCK